MANESNIDFIKVIDMTTPKDEGHHRVVSFAMNEKNAVPNTIRLMGGLSHNTTITFDRANAEKMRDFCQKILDCYK